MPISPFVHFDSESSKRDLLSPLWTFRLIPIVVLIAIGLAMTLFKSGPHHDFCLGFAVGQLLILLIASFSLRGVTMKDTNASKLEELSLGQ